MSVVAGDPPHARSLKTSPRLEIGSDRQVAEQGNVLGCVFDDTSDLFRSLSRTLQPISFTLEGESQRTILTISPTAGTAWRING